MYEKEHSGKSKDFQKWSKSGRPLAEGVSVRGRLRFRQEIRECHHPNPTKNLLNSLAQFPDDFVTKRKQHKTEVREFHA